MEGTITKLRIQDIPSIDRPREKMVKYGPEKLSSAELLAILLRTGKQGENAVEMAKNILRKFGEEKIVERTVEELKTYSGLGEAKACEIVACLELGKRFLQGKKAVLLLSPEDVWREMADLRESKKEHVVVFYLDTRNQAIKREIISVGTLNASLVHPREIFEPAIRCNAAQIIVAHNHPSGDVTPSAEDVAVTKRLVEAGKILGIEVVDHVIVSNLAYLSIHNIVAR